MSDKTVSFEQNDEQQKSPYENWRANNAQAVMKPPKKRNKIVIAALVIAAIAIIAAVYRYNDANSKRPGLGFLENYIAEISIEGEIAEDSYTAWMLDTIDELMLDDKNKGIFLKVNTPGGSVYASDELYLKLKEYKETTHRPVYAYFGSLAASGGYYVSAGSDKIYANRNCWTGSIGVTLGTMYDFSGLLERYGVKVVTITSGANKSMGSSYEEMTEEQRAIFQSLVDEAYDQFVGVVAEGRGMSVADVKKIADGRIYTAKQALEVGLIDVISSEEEAKAAMQTDNDLSGISFQPVAPEATDTMLSYFIKSGNKELSEFDEINELMKNGNTFEISYKANIKR